ncbi:hypothetical protein BGZ65_005653 [Modicella reniformis]|uniref:Uncharacterized protein n=1 Tax=Modicella reniformis TaxID=1440133 RepID=A0A9P6M3G8_9FUNG|nr:hypothetical protein BGZ65_005653 [Modicella reniformis]
MPKALSIFDIPLLVDRIGYGLDRHDQISCTLVNKVFYENFHPIVWNKLRYHNISNDSLLVKSLEQDQEILSKNTWWTRSVSVHTNANKGMTSLLSLSCKRLRCLSCLIVPSKVDRNDHVIAPVLDLTANNAELEIFSLFSKIFIPHSTLSRLPIVISKSPSMTSLKLEFAWRPYHGWLEYFLKNLPLTLRSLSVEWRRLGKYLEEEPFPNCDWPEKYPCVVTTQFLFQLAEGQEESLHRFLARLGRQIGSLIPLLQTNEFSGLTTLNLGQFNKITENQWMNLVMTLSGRIRSFTADVGLDTMSPNLSSVLVTHWAETLESLQFPCMFYSDTQVILAGCTKLKRFECMWTQDRESVPESQMKDWVCLDIEVLKLMFSDGRRVLTEESICMEQERRVVQRIEWAYRQLGRLTKVRELAIGWLTNIMFWGHPNLDMSLQGGLWHLSELKALEVLDVSDIRCVNVGMAEVQWMVKNWPMLKVIQGLRYRLNTVEEIDPESGSLPWLSSERLDLIIQ